SLPRIDRESLRYGAGLELTDNVRCNVDNVRCNVDSGDPRSRPRGRERQVSGPTGNVEHLLALLQRELGNEVSRPTFKAERDAAEVTCSPGGADSRAQRLIGLRVYLLLHSGHRRSSLSR